jgi:hypothetical protein
LDAFASIEKKKISKKENNMQRKPKTIRQTESKTVNKSRPRQDPESPLRR